MVEESIPGGYTEIKVLSDTMIEAWYQCADPKYPCPTGNTTWREFSRTGGSLGSHGGCESCLMTGIVWIKISSPPPSPTPPTELESKLPIIIIGIIIVYLFMKRS